MTEVGDEALDLLTVHQVAKKLNLSEKTVYRLIWKKELEALTVGTRNLRIAPEAVEEYKERLRAAARGTAA